MAVTPDYFDTKVDRLADRVGALDEKTDQAIHLLHRVLEGQLTIMADTTKIQADLAAEDAVLNGFVDLVNGVEAALTKLTSSEQAGVDEATALFEQHLAAAQTTLSAAQAAAALVPPPVAAPPVAAAPAPADAAPAPAVVPDPAVPVPAVDPAQAPAAPAPSDPAGTPGGIAQGTPGA